MTLRNFFVKSHVNLALIDNIMVEGGIMKESNFDAKGVRTMESGSQSIPESAKKPWQTPNMMEVDYSETRAGWSGFWNPDGMGGYS